MLANTVVSVTVEQESQSSGPNILRSRDVH
jgi:hypothetical protein